MKRSQVVLAILILATWRCGQVSSHAAVPQLITYQGKLTDLGPPLPPYWATFWIYDAPTNGVLLWGPETHDLGVPPNGLFTVQLGTANPIPAAAFSGTNAYLELAVQGTVLTPRTRMVTTPYAFQAENASWAGLAQRVYPNSISTDKLQDLAVTEEKIAWSAVTALRLADRAVTTEKLDHSAVTTVKIASGTSVDMVDDFHASDHPTGGVLLALDQAAMFPNVVLHTGHSNGLDADMVDGKHATNLLLTTPPITITGNEPFESWILKLVNAGTQATGITLLTTNDLGVGIVAGSAHGGPGVRGIAIGCADGYCFGVEGIGGGGVRGEAVIRGSGTNATDFQYGILGYSDRGVGVKAQSVLGKALIVDGTAEFNGNVLFNGGLSGQIDGDSIKDQTITGHKLFPGGGMAQIGRIPPGPYLWKFLAQTADLAALETETTATGTNAVALHSKAGPSGIRAPGRPIGMLGESSDGFAIVAQAASGVGIKGTSTSGIGVLAQAGNLDALALQALGKSDFAGAIEGALSHFKNAMNNSAARVHGLISEVTGLPGGSEPVVGILGRAGTNNQALGPIKIGVQGETDSGVGLVGISADGTAVWARSGNGTGLLAESETGLALRAIGHTVAGALVATNDANGLPGSPAAAVSAQTGGRENATAIHAKAGSSGLALPNLGAIIGESSSGVGAAGLSDTGIGVMAQAGRGTALKAESASGVAIEAVGRSASGTIVASNSSAAGLVGLSSSGPGLIARNSSTLAATVAATNTSSGDAVFAYSASGVSVHARNGNANSNALLVEGTARFTDHARFEGGSGAWVSLLDQPSKPIDSSTGAYLSSGGVWTDASDRAAKDNFTPVEARLILERVACLPIGTWNYKTEDPCVRHIGPLAQDFHAAFAVGADDKHIAALDGNGVALAAIQGLNQKLEEAAQAKDAEIAELKQTLAELKAMVGRVMARQNGGAQ